MSKSLWQEISGHKQYPSLSGNIRSDVTVVGGGIVGITAAYKLAQAGYEVTLIEANGIGSGTSGKNTGKVTIQTDAIYSYLAQKQSMANAKSYMLLNQKGLDYIRNEGRNNVDLTKEESAWIFSMDDHQARIIEEEYKTCVKLGLPVKISSSLPINVKVKNALELPEQISINPKQYTNHIADLAEKSGVRILESTKIIDIKKGDSLVLSSHMGHKVTTSKLILACHYPLYRRGGLMIPRLTADRSYIVAGEYSGVYPGGMYISIGNITRSIRTYQHGSRQILLVGGEGHRTGKIKRDSYSRLKEYGKRHFGDVDFKYQWSAQDYSTYDLIPFVGKVIGEENIYLATGFNKWGIAAGTGAALSICELIIDGVFASQKVFSPKRYSDILTTDFLAGTGTMAKEFVVSRIHKSDIHPPQVSGSAAIMTIGGKRLGVYRREDNSFVGVELTCTHLGCGLNFNTLDKSWDCPCHGSRFDTEGKVIDGPAASPLNKITLSFP